MLCNREIKFGAFRDYAKRLGGDLLATGHYARIGYDRQRDDIAQGQRPRKGSELFPARRRHEEALAETVFPLGDLQKNDVREIARDRGLPVYDKKDSTGICFIGERPFREFLSTYLPAKPGPIMKCSTIESSANTRA